MDGTQTPPAPEDIVDALLPLITEQIIEHRVEVKKKAMALADEFFPDKHKLGEECSDCLIIRLIVETIDAYLKTDLDE